MERLKIIEDIRALKTVMRNCFYWKPPSKLVVRQAYGEHRSVKAFHVGNIKIYATCKCSSKRISFKASSLPDLRKAEIRIIFNSLAGVKRREALEKFKNMDNPNSYKFNAVWNVLRG